MNSQNTKILLWRTLFLILFNWIADKLSIANVFFICMAVTEPWSTFAFFCTSVKAFPEPIHSQRLQTIAGVRDLQKQYRVERSNTVSFAIRDQSIVDCFILSIHCCPVAVHSCSFPYCGIDKWFPSDVAFTSSHDAHDTLSVCARSKRTHGRQ